MIICFKYIKTLKWHQLMYLQEIMLKVLKTAQLSLHLRDGDVVTS